MGIEVNYLAVLLAALSSMVIGGIWYAPKVFGGAWMKLADIEKNQNSTAKDMVVMYGAALVLSLITAAGLATVTFLAYQHLQYSGNSYLESALYVGLWVWLAFVATRITVHNLFENRGKRLTLLNVSHELVTIMMMALIIGLMGIR